MSSSLWFTNRNILSLATYLHSCFCFLLSLSLSPSSSLRVGFPAYFHRQSPGSCPSLPGGVRRLSSEFAVRRRYRANMRRCVLLALLVRILLSFQSKSLSIQRRCRCWAVVEMTFVSVNRAVHFERLNDWRPSDAGRGGCPFPIFATFLLIGRVCSQSACFSGRPPRSFRSARGVPGGGR